MPGGDGGMLDGNIILRTAPQTVDSQVEFNHPVASLGGFDDQRGHVLLYHVGGQDSDSFFEGGLAGDGASQPILPKRAHALLDGDVLEARGRHLLKHGFAEWLVDDQELADRQTAGVTGLVALIATGAPAELGLGDKSLRDDLELDWRRLAGLGAIRTDRANQPQPHYAQN